MKKFWNWMNQKQTETQPEQRILTLNGTIAEESWFDDDVTPQLFRDELEAGGGDITVWINSPGGDCIAAAQIYNMLSDYKGHITVKIDGIAASAASVIAMAGDEVLMSPVAMLMIHNPATIAMGDHAEMQKAIDMLTEVKESIINAYVVKTGLSRAKLSRLMDAETWMNAGKAVELGFADGILERASDTLAQANAVTALMRSRKAGPNARRPTTTATYGATDKTPGGQAAIPASEDIKHGRSAKELRDRLDLIEKII